MDIHSLVAANLSRATCHKMDAAEEDRYYRARTLPRLRLGALLPLASVAAAILLLVGVAQT